MRVHANDGIPSAAKAGLVDQGFTVTNDHVPQDQLADYINAQGVDVLLVRSATKVRRDLIDACPDVKLVGRGGVGLDNIEVAYAKQKGITVINTPGASSISVAELVMAHLFTLMRSLHKSNRRMPAEGRSHFKELKKEYEKGFELRGKTLGIIGFGRIGQWVARYALGCGMNVVYSDNHATAEAIEVPIGGTTVRVPVRMVPLETLLGMSDAISLHVPGQKDGQAVIGNRELNKVKPGVVIVNTARGGSIDEDALLAAIKDGRVRAAALDVFTNEPEPRADLLNEANISLSPHIGAATAEAQGRIGDELVDLILGWRSSVMLG
ncbi:MAG TPA: D-2-hydroxyacid dehydrogenase [Flavobacteriales bacterium]|nr:D-2-hydroxyacid dehydrogenase [Flavobacteriales bacterium]